MNRFVLLLAASLFACNANESAAPLRGKVTGTAWFLGPVAGAPVTLHLSDATGSDRGIVAEFTTEEDGFFFFRDLQEEAHYLVRIDLSGRPWATIFAEGAFAEGDRLETATGLIEPFARERERREREVFATPLSTLVLAIGEARRAVNRESPLPEALLGARAWLGLDPTLTAIGPRDGALDDSVRYTLLLDAFDALADQISASVGIQPGTAFNPPDLLRYLLADAQGPVPAGLFDGLGPDGPLTVDAARNYALSPATLQAELVDALDALIDDDSGTPWARLEPREIKDLLDRLTCSGSLLFPDCKTERTDDTPPQIVRVSPEPGEELSGERTLTIEFFDNEGAVVQAVLERLDRPDGAVVEVYPLTGEDRDRFMFQVDTRAVLGQSTLYLQTRATNDAGLTSGSHAFQYPIRNVGPGILEGVVFKGPASNVQVEVEGIIEGRWTPLGNARTNEHGRFNLPLTEYQGALRLTARGIEDEVGSFFEDEARGEPVRWGGAQRLVTVVPFYTPAQPEPVTVSPLGDLAVALAEAKVNTTGDDFPTAYAKSVASLAAHFGFADAGALLHAQPVDPGVDARGVTDAVRFTVALACLSEQAHGLGCEAFNCEEEDVSERFTALHLLEMYRQDALDGVFDGVNANGAIERRFAGNTEPVALPRDPLRHPLATDCGRWLQGELNGTGVSVAAYIGELQALSLNRDPWLFNAQLDRRPFDEAGPALRVELVNLPEEAESLVSGAALVRENMSGEPETAPPAASGRVLLRFVAEDDAGVAVLAPEGGADIQVSLLGDFPQNPLVFSPLDTPQGIQRQRVVEATLDLSVLPAAFEGRDLRFTVNAADLLQQRTSASFHLTVDRRPPEIFLSLPEGFREQDEYWHTRLSENRTVGLHIVAAGPVSYGFEFADESLVEADATGSDVRREGTLVLGDRQEGAHPLQAMATDRLGREAVAHRTIVIDRTAPRATLLPDFYRDESRAFTERDEAGNYAIRLPFDAEIVDFNPDVAIPYRKILTRLDALSENVPYLRFQVEDQAGQNCRDPEDCPHSAPAELLVRRPGDPEVRLTPLGLDGAIRGLQLTADTLGIDLEAPPNANTPWRLRFEVEDLAGNVTEVEGPEFRLNILPPPPFVEALPVESGLPLDQLSFENLGEVLQAGTPVVLGRYRITNPWPVPVSYFIDTPAPLLFEGSATIRPLEADHFIGDGRNRPPPGPLDDPRPWRVEPGCLMDGQVDTALQALAIESEVEVNGVAHRVVEAQLCRPKVEYPVVVPRGSASVDMGRVANGVFTSLSDLWGKVDPGADLEVEVLALTENWQAEIETDLRALLWPVGEHRYGERLDDLRVLFWNEVQGCPSPVAACGERGWWYTWRTRVLNSVRLSAPASPIRFAADCQGNVCARRAQSEFGLQGPVQLRR